MPFLPLPPVHRLVVYSSLLHVFERCAEIMAPTLGPAQGAASSLPPGLHASPAAFPPVLNLSHPVSIGPQMSAGIPAAGLLQHPGGLLGCTGLLKSWGGTSIPAPLLLSGTVVK